MKDSLKLTMDLTVWEWSMVIDAFDNYVVENGDSIDCSELIKYAQYIEERLGLDKP